MILLKDNDFYEIFDVEGEIIEDVIENNDFLREYKFFNNIAVPDRYKGERFVFGKSELYQDGILLEFNPQCIVPIGVGYVIVNLTAESRLELNVSRHELNNNREIISKWNKRVGCVVQKKVAENCIRVLKEKYLTIMHKALDAIREGGFHTPNHRWGIAAALLQGSNLFAAEKEFAAGLKNRAEQYLAEGIDGDEDGEYAERSTGNYNAVVNNAMMAMYQETGDEAFLGYVDRNLSMMLTYMDPDDTIFTQNSTRQDQGKLEYADKYFYQYLYMCSREKNPAFDGAAHKIIKDNMERGDLAPDCLHIVMNHDEMMGYHFEEYGFLEEYRKFFRHAGVLRVRKPSYTYTVLNGKSAFLYFKSKGTTLCVKIGESCCDIRNFIPQTIEELPDGCRLEAEAQSWYYLPFKEKQDTSDWWKMDQSKREKLISSRLKTTLEIREKEQGLELNLKAEGLDRLPLRLEICIPAGVSIEHPAFALEAGAGESMILKDGYLEIHDGLTTVEIGPGFGEHSFKGHYSGEEINSAGYTVYANGYTPLEKHFSLMVK